MFFTLMVGAPRPLAMPPREAHRRCFLTLMLGPHGSLTAPTRGPPSMFFTLIVGALGSPPTPRGPTVDIFYVDGGRSRIYVSTRQGAHRRHFLALMLGAPGCTAPAPPRGSAIDVSQC
jgi:hypothetical protein